ncbi:MFS transporter [Eggerthellaceae bacterium zg-887]|uniref:MFS transporter n=1 Tax=Xiamenia xianingshaonis TaxID=2682776 RepID=UPI00140838DE|nr:MFS transporter [Xiamenia xianingshaonis]NHM16993.1 MFS transporter [Xiamenia xianingshaonis]
MSEEKLWNLQYILLMAYNLCHLLFFLPMSFPAFVAIRAAHVVTYVVSYASELGLDTEVSFFFLVYSAAGFVLRPVVGKRVDCKGEDSVVYACFASLTAAFVLLAFVANAPMLIAAAAFTGFGVSITQSVMQAIMARDTPKSELGRANSTFFTSMDLGLGVGPILVGLLMPALGFQWSYLALAAIGPIAAVCYYLFHGRKQGGNH